MSTGRVPTLFRRLADDAALFPPGNAPMPVAVAEHRIHRTAPYADLVGPLLCPASRLDELLVEVGDEEPPVAVGLIGDRGPAHLAEAATAALTDPRVVLVQLECPIPAGQKDQEVVPPAVGLAFDLLAVDPAHRTDCFVEVPRRHGWLAVPSALGGMGDADRVVGAKLRTGGTSADAFPSDRELADFVAAATRADRPFKLTAGLHHAVRHTDPATGFEHHGYLNVLAAVVAAVDPATAGADPVDLIAERDPEPLRALVAAALDRPDRAGRARARFRSYGTCSIAEPLADLVRLGLLDRELLDHLPDRRGGHG